MPDEAERAYERVKRASAHLDEAWKNRVQEEEGLDAALTELSEAGLALVEAWKARERTAE